MDRRGWRQWTEQDAREALAELAGTGESIAEFARRRGVSRERVRYWRKRLADVAPAFVASTS
jgi:transposase-like protein